MFNNKKSGKIIATFVALVLILVNSVAAVAAPYGNARIEEIRGKALHNYFSSDAILGMSNSTGAVVNAVEANASVTYEDVTEIEAVNYSTIKRQNPSLKVGEIVTVREGVDGERAVVSRVTYKNGVEVARECTSSYYTKEPVSKIVEYGPDKVTVSATASATGSTGTRPDFEYKTFIDCEATAYDLSPEENGGYAGQSATGVPLDKGVIAVDPRVIPLGSRVYIEAIDGSWTYGYAVAADTGGAIKGKRVDLCLRTQKECIQFGRRPCRVYILN